MKYHLVSLMLLLAAAALSVVGFGSGMAIALSAAVALEVYFWIRVVRGKAKPQSAIHQPP